MSISPTALVEARALTRSFPMGAVCIEALRGVDLRIAPGEFVALTGASGSGKSTLLNIIGGLDRPTSGYCRFAGVELATLPDCEAALMRATRIGFVFQMFNLIPELTALENVELPLLYGRATRIRERALDALDWVGLSSRWSHRPSALSGGEMQRVAIARAVAAGPDLLLADEPTGNLDTETAKGIMELFRKLHARGCAVLMVTHDALLAGTAGRIVRMAAGSIMQESNQP